MSALLDYISKPAEETLKSPFGPKDNICDIGATGLKWVGSLGMAFAVAHNADGHIIRRPFSADDETKVIEQIMLNPNRFSKVQDTRFIQVGIPRILEYKWLKASLDNHSGNLLSDSKIEHFKKAMMPFSGLLFTECNVSYSPSNEAIRAIVLLEDRIRLDLTLFLDEIDEDSLAFSLEHTRNLIFEGVGLPDEIAAGVKNFMSDLTSQKIVLS